MLVVSKPVGEKKRWLLYPRSSQILSIPLLSFSMWSQPVSSVQTHPGSPLSCGHKNIKTVQPLPLLMPSSLSIMLSEPCFCWLCHVSIILLMYYILFLLAKWIYKICPMCIIAYSYVFLVESSRQFLYQVLLEYLLCARPFMIWALALSLVSSHFLLQWF